MIRKVTSFLLTFVLLFTVAGFAQQNTGANGTVTDDKGSPLAGVSIQAINSVTNASSGTQTDSSGVFRFSQLPAGSYSFTFGMIGHQTQNLSGYNLKAGENTTINVTLVSTSMGLDQVTVVGYGSQRKRDLTTAVVGIKAKDMENQPINNVAEAMVGKMPGVQVVQGTGQPGTPLSVKVRGVGTITAGTEPLYVVDNFPLTGNNLNTLNTYDIESIEVLKDASSAAIYGSRGSNGVVLITTKQGKRGKPVVSVNSLIGVQSVAKKIDMLDAYGYSALVLDARNNAYSDQMISNNLRRQAQGLAPIAFGLNDNNATRLANTANNTNTIIPSEIVPYLSGTQGLVNTDWQDEIFQNALMQNHSVSVSGGSENFRYHTSLEYLNQDGIIVNSNFNRYGARINLDGNRGIFKFGMNLNPSVLIEKRVNSDGTYTSAEGGGVVSSALHYSPIWPVYNSNGSYSYAQNSWNGDARTTLGNGSIVSGNNQTQAWNPVALAREQKFDVNSSRILGNLFAEAAFTKDLKYKVTFGYDLFNYRTDKFRPSTIPLSNTAGNPESNATGSSETGTSFNWLLEQTLTYNKKINDHSFALLGGWSLQKDDARSNYAFASSGFISNQIPTLNAGIVTAGNSLRSQWTLASGIARLQYNYQGKYLLTASMRADGSSKFGSNNRWGYFPSVSAGWRISDETFLKSSELISDLKLRASYGLTGNFKIPNYGALGSLSYYAYVFGATPTATNGAAPSSQPNPDLSWEKTAQVNFGLDGALFQNNLTFSFDYYNSNTTDLLLNVPVPLSTGFSTELVNIGKVNNRGFEINLGTQQKIGALTWGASANFSTNKNKVIELGPGNADIINTGSVANAYFITRVGQPIGSYFLPMQDGVFKTQAEVNGYPHFEDAASNYGLASTKPGDFKFVDADGDKIIDLTKDRMIIGSYQPKFTYGFSTDFQFKGFDLAASLQGVHGSKILNLGRRYFYNHEGNMNNYADAANRWKSEADPGSGVNVRANRVGKGQNGITSSWHIEDGSYLRIRNITLGYSFNGNMLQRTGLSKARLYVTAQNPFIFTNYQGYNPEVSNRTATTTNGEDYGVYPTAKTFSVGINLTF